MTQWHIDWQSHFTVTEIELPIIENQYKKRRVDIQTPCKTHNIEIQHSNIIESDIIERTHDYKLHGLDTIWILDGRYVTYEKLNTYQSLLI